MKHVKIGGALLLSCLLLTVAVGAYADEPQIPPEKCPDYALFSQRPAANNDLAIRIWGNDDLIALAVSLGATTFKKTPYAVDDFEVSAPINEVVWWGTEMDLGQVPAERYQPLFTLTFFEKDDTVSPDMPGAVVVEFENVLVNREFTGIMYFHPDTFQPIIPLYRYSFTLPAPLTLSEGYIRIRGAQNGSLNPEDPYNADLARGFVQVSSPDGNRNLREFNGEDMPYKVRDDASKQYDIAVCFLPVTEEVPDVVNMDIADAEQALAALGFVLGAITYEYDTGAPAGQILEQTPAALDQFPVGGAIDLTVAADRIPVPNLVGKTQEEAEDLLAALGLILGNVTQVYSNTVPEGQVLQQSVAAGTEVELETVVNLVLSRGKEIIMPAAGAAALIALSAALAGLGIARNRRK
ncbi:MAG: PASTA domain-containing protein [Candidatus Hydrogenedens sp.]|nr:PASTA domain-containing protein [Candidatus Hydrogenedens sp.]